MSKLEQEQEQQQQQQEQQQERVYHGIHVGVPLLDSVELKVLQSCQWVAKGVESSNCPPESVMERKNLEGKRWHAHKSCNYTLSDPLGGREAPGQWFIAACDFCPCIFGHRRKEDLARRIRKHRKKCGGVPWKAFPEQYSFPAFFRKGDGHDPAVRINSLKNALEYFMNTNDDTLNPYEIARRQENADLPLFMEGLSLSNELLWALYGQVQQPGGLFDFGSDWLTRSGTKLPQVQAMKTKVEKERRDNDLFKTFTSKSENVCLDDVIPGDVAKRLKMGFATTNKNRSLEDAIRSALVYGVGVLRGFVNEHEAKTNAGLAEFVVENRQYPLHVNNLPLIDFGGMLEKSIQGTKNAVASKNIGNGKNFAQVRNVFGILEQYHKSVSKQFVDAWNHVLKANPELGLPWCSPSQVSGQWIFTAEDLPPLNPTTCTNEYARYQPPHGDGNFKPGCYSFVTYMSLSPDYHTRISQDQTNFFVLSSKESQMFLWGGGMLDGKPTKAAQDFLKKLKILPPNAPSIGVRKDAQGVEYGGYKPEVGDLFIFDSNLVHRGGPEKHNIHFVQMSWVPKGLPTELWDQEWRPSQNKKQKVKQ